MKPRTDFQVDQVKAAISPTRYVEEELDKMRAAYEAGDKRQLALAIQLCGGLERVMPERVVAAFNAGLQAMVECEADSWDEILGANPTGKRLANARRNRRRSLVIVKLLEDHPDGPINADFFEALAKRMRKATRADRHVTSDQVRNLYYQLPEGVRLTASQRPRRPLPND